MDSQCCFIGPVIDFVDKRHDGIAACFQFYDFLRCSLNYFGFNHRFIPFRSQRIILGKIPNYLPGFVDINRVMYGNVDFLHCSMIAAIRMQTSLAALRLCAQMWATFLLRTFCRDAAKIFLTTHY